MSLIDEHAEFDVHIIIVLTLLQPEFSINHWLI